MQRLAAVTPVVFSTAAPELWLPILPDDVPKCEGCQLPCPDGLCASCRRLKEALGWPVETVDVLTVSTRRDDPEALIWHWKNEAVEFGLDIAPGAFLATIGERLARHLTYHADRLLDGEPLITAVPSRAPLIEVALREETIRGAAPFEVAPTGSKNGSWAQHLTTEQRERLARRPVDWRIDTRALDGRPVVLVDDVFVTGASIFSYAAALKDAGAGHVRAVAVARHVDRWHTDYFDALEIARLSREWSWSSSYGITAS